MQISPANMKLVKALQFVFQASCEKQQTTAHARRPKLEASAALQWVRLQAQGEGRDRTGRSGHTPGRRACWRRQHNVQRHLFKQHEKLQMIWAGEAGGRSSRGRGSRGRSSQAARTKSVLGTDAQCMIQKQPRQGAGSRGGSTKRRTASTKRKKRVSYDEDSDEDEGVDEEVVLQRMRNAPRRRLEPML